MVVPIHSWDDHRAALQKFAPPKSKGKSSEKGKGEGTGKGRSHEFTEPEKEGETDEQALVEFVQAANCSCKYFAALTDAPSSGKLASSHHEKRT